jgi:hypothetical protein
MDFEALAKARADFDALVADVRPVRVLQFP